MKNGTLVCKTWKTRTLAGIVAVVAAVALPQIFHLLGRVSDMGTTLGETFLPMHIAIFFAGFLAGPLVGGIAGGISPIISFALTGMPTAAMLPYMIIELAAYGLISGLLSKTKLPTFVKLLIAQIGGRALRGAAIAIGFYAFGSAVKPAIILNSILVGLPGILLQWLIVPLAMFYIEKKTQK